MGFQTFVLEKGENLFSGNKIDVGISKLGEIISYYSFNFPISYSITSILLVIIVGVAFSYIREFIHYIRFDLKKTKT